MLGGLLVDSTICFGDVLWHGEERTCAIDFLWVPGRRLDVSTQSKVVSGFSVGLSPGSELHAHNSDSTNHHCQAVRSREELISRVASVFVGGR